MERRYKRKNLKGLIKKILSLERYPTLVGQERGLDVHRSGGGDFPVFSWAECHSDAFKYEGKHKG
jgi:hypothetical protein